MAKTERPSRQWIDEEGRLLDVTWSRSGRNLILTVAADAAYHGPQQVLLSQAQVADLAAFLQDDPT